jgi:hypothetical protein
MQARQKDPFRNRNNAEAREMIEGVGEATIRCSKKAIVDFVTNLETYKKADLKIGRVLEQTRIPASETSDGLERIFMRHDGTMRGVPGPPVSLEMVIESEHLVSYRAVPSFPSRFVLTFNGGFELHDLSDDAGAVRVVHTERFYFYFPFRLIAEPFLRTWIANDVREEMLRLKQLLESAQNEN